MKIAFFLDVDDPVILKCAEKCINAAKQYGEVIQLTTPEGKLVTDNHIIHDVTGTFSNRRWTLHSLLDEALFIDVDVLLKEDVSHIFEKQFDVAIATDIAPGDTGVRYNSGVAFSRSPQFWRDLREATEKLDFCKSYQDWVPIEQEMTNIIESGKYDALILPGEIYNQVPFFPSDETGKIVHYRGLRKDWM